MGGESGVEARPCNYDWILSLREQCVERDIPFRFHQTGAHFIKDGKMYRVKRCHQLSQAHKANIDYKIGKYLVPETVKFEREEQREPSSSLGWPSRDGRGRSQWKDSDYHD